MLRVQPYPLNLILILKNGSIPHYCDLRNSTSTNTGNFDWFLDTSKTLAVLSWHITGGNNKFKNSVFVKKVFLFDIFLFLKIHGQLAVCSQMDTRLPQPRQQSWEQTRKTNSFHFSLCWAFHASYIPCSSVILLLQLWNFFSWMAISATRSPKL